MQQLLQLLQNPQNLMEQFSDFVKNFNQQYNGQNPQQMVQQMLNSGQMSQAQFNQYREYANKILGVRF